MKDSQRKAMFAKKRSISNPEIDRKKIYAEVNADIPFVGGIRVGENMKNFVCKKQKGSKTMMTKTMQ